MAPKKPDVPVPLTRLIRGCVDVHFRSGHVANLKVTLHGAQSLRLQVEEVQGGESIDGLESHAGWIAARSEEVVLTEWTPEPDYGWHDTAPDDRERLLGLGMKHGVLGALADLWADRGGKPAYSITAVSALFGLATKAVVTRKEWDRIAEMVEGDDGAAFLATALGTLTTFAVPDDLIDDGAEPEAAPAAAETSPEDPGDAAPDKTGSAASERHAEDGGKAEPHEG